MAVLAATAPIPASTQPPTALPVLSAFSARGAGAAARAARAAQRRYELARRRLLYPYAGEAATRCDVVLGRICYWDNNGDARPPAESPAARRARGALLADLARAAAADPVDDWIAGQRVRYLIEAARAEADSAAASQPVTHLADRATASPAPLAGWLAADSTAAACRGTPWWCQALVGLVAHAAGRHAAATVAFDSARALLPDSAARCAWDDLGPWLPDRVLGPYRRLPCGSADRVRYEARAWRLAQPFWTLGANDLRAELAARRTLVRLHASGENPQALPWGEDLATSDVRYGVPTAWSVRDPIGLNGQPSVVGHEPTPSYDFWPDARVLAPAALLAASPRLPDARAWNLRRDGAQTRYAPSYAAAGVYALPHQLARFRRGDTLVIVGTYDALERGDSVPPGTSTGPVRAGFVLDDLRDAGRGPPADAVRDTAPRQGALVLRVLPPRVAATAAVRDSAPVPAWLASLEVIDGAAVRYADGQPRRGRAGRARVLVTPLAPGAPLSDLLVVRAGLAAAAPVPTLDAAVDSAAGAPVARTGDAIGLYWEQYDKKGGGGGSGGGDTVVITATRLDPSWRERAGALIGRPVVLRPVRVRYLAARGAGVPGAPAARVVTLRWPDVPPGAYRVDVTVPGAAGAPATTSAVVRVTR